jgi:hypothetical protein
MLTNHGPMLIFLSATMMISGNSQLGTSAAKKCPPVMPKNRQEALMMESSSNKKGCWARDKDSGQLVFLSDQSPDRNYLPMMEAPQPGVKPVCRVRQQGAAPNDFTGTWLVSFKCVHECSPVPGVAPEDQQMLQTVTVHRRLPKVYRVSFGTFPEMDGCEAPLDVMQKPNLSYSGTTGTGANPIEEGCHPRTVELEPRLGSFVVRTRYESGAVWEGVACPTSAPPGAWFPQGSLENGKIVYRSGTWMTAPQ